MLVHISMRLSFVGFCWLNTGWPLPVAPEAWCQQHALDLLRRQRWCFIRSQLRMLGSSRQRDAEGSSGLLGSRVGFGVWGLGFRVASSARRAKPNREEDLQERKWELDLRTAHRTGISRGNQVDRVPSCNGIQQMGLTWVDLTKR